ncbi:hypothetical protein [Streptomyces albospinus]|uniref:hypothetical protein n=1 Tax=Streptomyces albospinus TaxID=285515 RepID=UPI00166FA37D|nr:hypothetical protein [Streptomyces albospinus]
MFLVLAPIMDLVYDHAHGLPADHAPVFAKLAGASFDAVKNSAPGTAKYATTLEYGYALHELTFALLFLTVVLVPFRRGERWAWFACWIVLIAAVGYTVTFAHLDSTLLWRSLIADIAVPVLLLLSARSFFTAPTEQKQQG